MTDTEEKKEIADGKLELTSISEKTKNIPQMHILAIGLALLVVVAGGTAGYLYNEYANLKDPNGQNQKKIEQVIEKVSKLIDVPSGEVPTLATITNAESLKDQLFFQNAQIGDQVLLYNTARKAYLYRPSQNILVEVASLNIGQ